MCMLLCTVLGTTGKPAKATREHRELLKQHIYSDYKQMYRQPTGIAFKFPYLTPGSRQYAHVLWDWDSWLSNVALRQILAYTSAADAQQPVRSAVMAPQQHRHHEATLTDASQLYRICSSRPQRILPTQGSKTERTITPCGNMARRHHVKPLHSFYDSRLRQETAPFCLSASRDYYVIALRHIIR